MVCDTLLSEAQRAGEEAPQLSVAAVAVRLYRQGYKLRVRNATSRESNSFKHLRHQFLLVTAPGSAQVSYVVDVLFREQWCIPQPSPTYAAVLDALPEVLVAPATSMPALVKLLSPEVAASFEMRKMALPPWRTQDALMSKWAPAKPRDEVVVEAKSSGTRDAPGASDEGSQRKSGGTRLFTGFPL